MSDQLPINAAIIPVTDFQQNCTLLWETKTMTGVFIDPGGQVDLLINTAQSKGVNVKEIWITHGHMDHAGGAAKLAKTLNIPVIGPHSGDQNFMSKLQESGQRYGMMDAQNCTPTRWLNDGDKLNLGDIEFDVVHCPGHTPGHVCIINKDLKLAFVGDVLFKGSIGRTDFEGGNYQQLIDSITKKLWPYGEDIQFISGHGPMSTFGYERKTNPFVSDFAV